MKKAWHRFQRYYFSYNRSDRNAIVILAGLILIVWLGYLFLPYFIPHKQEDFSEIKAAFEKWEQEQLSNKAQLYLFNFDPNTISEEKLDSLDLPAFIKQNIVRYREAGGKYRTQSDLHKIYGMTDSIFGIVQPYIQIEESTNASSESTAENETYKSQVNVSSEDKVNFKYNSEEVVHKMIELNSADSVTLVALPGIGPVFARRIIRFRNLLGGFVRKEQLLEVYNFPPETYERISALLEVDTTSAQKLRINFLDYSELLRHPYLNQDQVEAIIDRRERMGAFKNLSEIASIQTFDSETFARIRPYLTCE